MAQPPEVFVPRHQLGALVELLCQAAAQPAEGASVGITTALRGAGGFGKTTLAQRLSFEPAVRRGFPDGILWVTMGEQVSEAGRLGRVLDLLRWWSNAEPPAFTEVGPASAELRRRLAGQRVLVVVDDVWQSADLVPFQGLGAGAAVLVTTRDRSTLPCDCQDIEVDAMDAGEATALLGRDLGLPADHAGLRSLALRLGQWPLLLGLANGRLRDLVGKHGLEVRAAIAKVADKLARKGLTSLDDKNTDARDRAVRATMAVSLEALSGDEGRCYEQLAIFPEDIDIPIAVLARAWWPERPDEDDAEEVCERLHDLSLVRHIDLTGGTVRLHDVFRHYLIDHQRDAMPALHAQWLEAFCPASGRWHDLSPDDAYAWHHLAYHLRHAGQGKRLHALLFDFAWLDAKLRAADVSALLADFEHVVPSLDEDAEARLVRDGLRLSSHVLAGDADQLPSQLVGRLGDFEESHAGIGVLLAQIRILARTPWLCPVRSLLTAPGGALERTLAGHSHMVTAVAVTRDGQRAISASDDQTLKVWDLGTGQLQHTLAGHDGWVTAVAVTRDGHRAISASDDHTLKVWDLGTGQLQHTLAGHDGWVRAVAITRDGQRAISASDDQTLKVWDLGAGKLQHTLAGHAGLIRAVAITRDGQRAVSASHDQTLKIWDLGSGKLQHTLAGHSSAVRAVAITRDGQRAVSASADQTLKVWDLGAGKLQHTLAGHAGLVRAVAITRDGQRAVSASADQTLKVWNLGTGQLQHTLAGHSSAIRAVAITPDGRRALSASWDNTLKVWDLGTGQRQHTLAGHSRPAVAVAITPDGRRALSASWDNTLKVWDLGTGQRQRTLAGHSRPVMATAVTPDGQRAISASHDQTLKVWDLGSGKLQHTLVGHEDLVTAVAISRDSQRAISASHDQSLKVWDLGTGQLQHTLAGHRNLIRAVAITRDGQRAVSASHDQTLKVWDLGAGKRQHTLAGHSGPVRSVAITRDGQRAVSASHDQSLKVWDLGSGKLQHTLAGHSGSVTAVAVTPDGMCAISASHDQTLKVWDLGSGKLQHTLAGHSGPVTAVAVTLDGMRAISTAYDMTLMVWDIASGRAVARFSGDAAMRCVAASNNDRIVAGDMLGRVHLLRLIREST